MFKQALEFYKENKELETKVKIAFGDYLEIRKYPEEAGFLFSTAGDDEKGIDCFKKCLNVEMCLA